jgi:hypothetical protein
LGLSRDLFTSRGSARFHLRSDLSQCEQQLTLISTVTRSIVLVFVVCLIPSRCVRCVVKNQLCPGGHLQILLAIGVQTPSQIF